MPQFCSVFVKTWNGGQGFAPSATFFLDAPCPGADSGIAAAVRVQNGQRIRRTGLTLYGHEHATLPRQRVEDASVMRLKPDTTHRPGKPELAQILRPAERLHKRSPPDRRANTGELEPFRGRAERSFDERGRVGTVLDQNCQRLDGKTGLLQRVDAFVRPLDVLKHAHGESLCLDLDHGE